MQSVITNADDKQYMKEYLATAGLYADHFNIPMETAFLNLESLHKEYTGQNFVKKGGFEATVDSLKLNFIMPKYNYLAQQWAKNPDDPHLEQALIEHEREIDRLKDHAPKVWSDDYIKMGGWHDIGQAFRSVFTTAAENAGTIVEGAALAGLTATGAGALATAAKLSTTASRLLVAGASRAAIGVNTYNSSWGIKYREMTNSGFPKDIALSFAKRDAIWEGVIEGALGGIEAAGGKAIASSVIPQAFNQASAKYFISGKLGIEAKAVLNFLREGGEEFSEEFLQTLSSADIHNQAVDELNKRREQRYKEIEKQLEEISEPYRQTVREELEAEIAENYPDIDKTKIESVMQDAWEAGIGAFWTSVLFGGAPISVQYKNDKRAALAIAEIAKEAPNMAAMREQMKAKGIEVPIEDFNEMEPEAQDAIYKGAFDTAQERLSPEQREAKQKAEQDAEFLAEITDYSDARVKTVVDSETGEATVELKTIDTGDIYREDGDLHITEYANKQEDGTVNGAFIAANPTEYKEKLREYGHIHYTENPETKEVVITDFVMKSRVENLRPDLYAQFADRFSGYNIKLSEKLEANTTLKSQLMNDNPRGIEGGLNYRARLSQGAKEVMQKIRPFMPSKTSSLGISLAAEFMSHARRKGETIEQTMGRLGIEFTNTPNYKIQVAQTDGILVKGAHWIDSKAKTLKNFIYLSKNAESEADISTFIHEYGHALAKDFSDAERRIAARALNGYKLKNGTAVYFDPSSIREWTDEQHEAFAEALENYCTNGTAPNDEIKPIFERIKRFMKQVYEKMKKWTELSPQVEKFYQDLFSGELVDQAQAEIDPRDTAIEQAAAQREQLITDPELPIEAKTEAIFNEAGEEYLYQIIGERGAAALDKAEEATHRMDNLVIAKQMEAAEKDPKTIRLATGWERGADSKWRYEIADLEITEAAKKKALNEKEVKLSDLIIADELFIAYPELINYLLEVTEEEIAGITDASFLPNNKRFEIDFLSLQSPSAKDTIAHEIQHAIQQIEGFAQGSSPSMFTQKNNKQQVLDNIKAASDKAWMEIPENLHNDARRINREEDTDGKSLEKIQADPIAKAAWADYIRAQRDYKEIKAMPYEKFNGLSAYDQYFRTAGEVEARNVQQRSRLNQRERLINTILRTEDISREDQIFINQGILFQTQAYNLLEENNESPIADTNTEEFKNWFGNSKVVDKTGNPLTVYHGTARPDRFNNKFDPRKATSGPMAFFTDNKMIGENYARNKQDTSLQYDELDPDDYANWFRVKTGRGKPQSLVNSWYRISPEQRTKIKELALKISFDDEADEIIIDEKNTNGSGNMQSNIKESRGNIAQALVEEWLNSGNLFGREEEFKKVLELAGFDMTNIIMYDPSASTPAVFPVYLNIRNPLDTADINNDTLNALKQASKRARRRTGENADHWDKNNTVPKEWIADLEKDIKDGTAYVWTSIPDWVTNTLKNLGYDGIKDKGGKYHDTEHTVWIPFTSTQVKSIYNRGTFDPEKTNILFQISDEQAIQDAATMKDGKEYIEYIKTFGDLPQELLDLAEQGVSDEAIFAWADSFVQNAKKAVETTEQGQQAEITGETPQGKTPAELDREFNNLIDQELDDFVKIATVLHNDDGRQGALEEADQRAAEAIQRTMKHPTWKSIFMAGGRMGDTQRKQLLTLIKRAPREYRAIYSMVMERPDLAVSEADTTAEALKYRITDSRREDIDSLSPEKLRQLAEDLDVEDFAEKVRTGRAKFNEPIEKEYIRRLQEQKREAEKNLEEAEADRDDDNIHIERQIGAEFNKKFENALKTREEIRSKNKQLDKAIETGEKDAARIARELQREKSNYDTIVKSLQALARTSKLELDLQAILAEQNIKDTLKAAKTEKTLAVRLARKAAASELRAHIEELNEQRKAAKEITKAKRTVVKRIFRKLDPHSVNADQGMSIAVIQDFAKPSFHKGVNEFINDVVEHDLRTIYEAWKVDELLRGNLLLDIHPASRRKMRALLNKGDYDALTDAEKRYMAKKIAPEDWIEELHLDEIAERREQNYPITEELKQLALDNLPSDIYYRVMDKPFSQWTLSEAEELAKIIDDLTVRGKQLYKANIQAERKRIRNYQDAIVNTIRTVKPGLDNDEAEKILGKYDGGVEGTAQSSGIKRKLKGALFRYADMNVYRFARMLDNGDIHGKNSAALYRREADAYNQEMTNIDKRNEKIKKLMKDLGIKDTELWQKTDVINLGAGKRGDQRFTKAELLGFLSATRDDYSRSAVMYGNMLSEQERAEFQRTGVIPEELNVLKLKAAERFERVETAAKKLVEDNPNYQKLLDAIDDDFREGGKRLSNALVKYNNSFMPTVEHYFPMQRENAISSQSSDAQEVQKIMGSTGGAFNLYVEKGFTKGRTEIPIQYQRGIKLDLLGVWADSINKEEHFIAYGQLVKDLNQIYKQNRQVRDTIQRRHGKLAVDYIDKYIGELASPETDKTKSELDKFVRGLRGNTAAAYLGWKTSSIALQAITSPAPFLAYMNPLEYWSTYIEFVTHKNNLWNEICELSPHMKHRSMNMMIDLIKEQAKNQFDNKATAAINQFNNKGIQGLEWIDRISVAPGWLTLYRKEHKKLTSENKNSNMSEEDIRVKAAQHADDIVRLTQPSGRTSDLSPLFKGNSELGKAFLQFTQSLNVIWQNIRYDMPQMAREKQSWNVAGTIIGYSMAGLMMGLVMTGFDDDDDETDKIKKLAWWTTTQFTDSIPLVGSAATGVLEYWITGDKPYKGFSGLFPTAGLVERALTANKLDKSVKLFAEAAMMHLGLPTSGTKELGRVFGIGDGDGELDFNPEALLGRR